MINISLWIQLSIIGIIYTINNVSFVIYCFNKIIYKNLKLTFFYISMLACFTKWQYKVNFFFLYLLTWNLIYSYLYDYLNKYFYLLCFEIIVWFHHFPILFSRTNPPIYTYILSFKFMPPLKYYMYTSISISISNSIFIYIYLYIPKCINITCLVFIMILVHIFLGLTIWYLITDYVFFSETDYFSTVSILKNL